MPAKPPSNRERYELGRSPFSQNPTQRDLALLLRESRDDLRRLVRYKEQFIVRRTLEIRGKMRALAYPEGRLRAAHERLKYHFNKVRQPNYLFSPRPRLSQRDNASVHIDQQQYLTLDLKQFYPSTSADMVLNFFVNELGMYEDVARLLIKLCTIDDRVSLGSPFTPVLCTFVHRRMFNSISDVCCRKGLRYSVWVDDLTISGTFVPGEVVSEIREIVRSHGLKSHKILYRNGSRPVFITGIGIVGTRLMAPNALHLRIKHLWNDLHNAETVEEKEACTQKLLSQLGTMRHITGRKSELGRKAADQMNTLRQKLDRSHRLSWADFQSQMASRVRDPVSNAPLMTVMLDEISVDVVAGTANADACFATEGRL